eukprot:4328686-Prymnesium_polylepis.1
MNHLAFLLLLFDRVSSRSQVALEEERLKRVEHVQRIASRRLAHQVPATPNPHPHPLWAQRTHAASVPPNCHLHPL